MITLRMGRVEIACLAISCCFVAGLAHANTYDGRPRILLHLVPATGQSPICAAGALAECQGVNTAGFTSSTGEKYYAYLMVARGSTTAVSGFQCGIAYSQGKPNGASDGMGVDVLDWVGCAGIEYTNTGWPQSGGSNLITWAGTENCQSGELGVAGYFYVAAFGADTMRVTLRPIDGRAAVAECVTTLEVELAPDELGSVVFSPAGSVTGCNACLGPCGAAPSAQSTWGQIKQLYQPR